MRSRMLIGPFAGVHRASGNPLKFTVPRDLRGRVREPALRDGLRISPEKIARAYKDGLSKYWILVEYERGYDLYKHFRLDGNPYLMHHKVMIVDGEVAVTGSYNWSWSAENRNDENLVIIRDAETAPLYEAEFQRVWSQAA